jgi:hypothetical protein
VEGSTSVGRSSIEVVFVYVEMTTKELITSTVDSELVIELCGSGMRAYVCVM